MSSFDAWAGVPLRLGRIVAAVALLGLGAACTVRPLYGDMTGSTPPPAGSVSARLRSIAISPAETRVEQEVRNQLLFLLNGGRGEADQAAYELDLNVTARRASAAAVQPTTRDLEPTAAVVVVNAAYVLKDGTGTAVASGVRTAQAAYDIPRQVFADQRARLDAENRAAREVAEIVRLTLAQEFERPSGLTAPAIAPQPTEIDDELYTDDDGAFFR